MKIERLTLRNFRNLEEATFEASPRLNFLVGQNGQGKTSVIEALGYLATLRSFRGAKTDEVISWGASGAEIVAQASPEGETDWRVDLKIAFQASQSPQNPKANRLPGGRASKVAFVNGKAFRSSTAYLSQRFGSAELGFHAVVFNPSDHDLVRGEPSGRRAYLDRVLAAESLEFLEKAQRYQKLLEQRNALLKLPYPPQPDVLAGFTEPMAELAAWIVRARLEWIQRARGRLAEIARQIAPRQPVLSLDYTSSWAAHDGGFSSDFDRHQEPPSLEKLEQSFWTQQSMLREAELRAGSTLVGPHRDDWMFRLGEQPLKGHGSQGEVRSALLALKLCEIELFRARTGHRPLMLLDDFSSELDRERRAFLLDFLQTGDLQVFVTSTEGSLGLGKRFAVTDGRIEEARA